MDGKEEGWGESEKVRPGGCWELPEEEPGPEAGQW